MDDTQADARHAAGHPAGRGSRVRTGLGPAVGPVLIGLALLALSWQATPSHASGLGADIPRHLGFSRLELIVNVTGMLVACALPLAWGAWSCRRDGFRLPGVAAIVMGIAICCTFSGQHLAQARHAESIAGMFARYDATEGRVARAYAGVFPGTQTGQALPVTAPHTTGSHAKFMIRNSEASETMAWAWLAIATGALLAGLLLPTGGARPARVLRLTPPAAD